MPSNNISTLLEVITRQEEIIHSQNEIIGELTMTLIQHVEVEELENPVLIDVIEHATDLHE